MSMNLQDVSNEDDRLLESSGQLKDNNETQKNSSFQATITYIIAFLGIGILTLPYGFKMGGLVVGLAIMLILAFCASYAYKLLVWCKKELHQQGYVYVNTYTEIGEKAMGTAGVVLSNVGLIANQLGVSAAYVVFIGDNLQSLFKSLTLVECVLISVPLLIAISLIRDIKFLGKTSMIALSSLAIAIIVIMWTGLTNKPPIHKINILPTDFFLFFGIAVMAYSGISVCIPIEDSMAKPEQYNTVLHVTLIFLFSLYCGFGLLTYAFFGDAVNDVITDNLRNDWEAMVAKIGLICLLLFGIPVQLFSVYQIVENSLQKRMTGYSRWTFIVVSSVLRVVILLGTVGVAIVVPLFGLFTNLIGSLCTTMITYVFPPLFHGIIYYKANKMNWKYYTASGIIMAIGIGGGGASSVVTLKKIIQALSK